MKIQIKTCLMMLVIFGGMFFTATTAQSSLQTKILATAEQPTTDEATQKKITELIAQLGDENDTVRRDAAWNLGRIADSKTQSFVKEAVQPLLKALVDKSPYVRTYAASALGKIGDIIALQPLINALGDSNPNVRLFAANALGLLGDSQAEQPLNNLLKDQDERVRKMAAKALTRIRAAPQPGKEISKKEQTEETKQALPVSIDTQKRIDGFITQLGDTNVRLRNSAVQHLKAIGKPTEQSLIKALEDSSPNPLQSLVILLGDIGDVQAIKPLYKVLNEGNSNISKSAGLALGKIKTRVTSEEWDKEVQEYREDRVSRMRESRRLEMEKLLTRPPAVRPRLSERPPIRYYKPTNAFSNVFGWIYINVDIEIQDNGDLLISEEQKYSFPRWYSNVRYRWLPTDKLDEIKDVEVYELAKNDKVFSEPRQLSPQIEKKRGQFWIRWAHELNPPETCTFLLKYRVIGGLLVNKSTDELCWKAVAKSKPDRVGTSRVRVHLPPPLLGKTRASLGHGIQASIETSPDGSTIEFNSIGSIPRQLGLEVRISFPHDILNIKKPKWQGLWARARARWPDQWPVLLMFILLLPLLAFKLIRSLVTGDWSNWDGGGCGGGGCGGGCGGGGCGGGG
ncbi:MAG: HEAT repeat domain-containing protein [Planctomycetota bacterium]|jgi:HEAT repeat protein